MFVDRKEAMPPENMQLGLRKSESPDRHGVDEMIFVTDVDIVYMLVSTFGVARGVCYLTKCGFRCSL